LLSRNTYLELNTKNIQNNVYKIINKYNNYKYYIGVVKADCYGHGDMKIIKSIIEGGCNYLAVATLDEAIEVRKEFNDIPILCLGHIPSEYIDICKNENIAITIHSLEYAKELLDRDCTGLKVHLKINTGMNRLGINDINQIDEVSNIIKEKNAILEGVYTHIYNAEMESCYLKQINEFKKIISNLNQVPIIHISASESIELYEKPSFVNGCRLGIIMYGFTENKELKLQSTMQLISEVIQIHNLSKGDTVGYNGAYVVEEDSEKIAVISIGYADGIIRKNTGRMVYINNKEYKIVGNICMDMLFVKVDDTINIHDKVYLLKDNKHIKQVSKHLDTIPYEVMCCIGKRVPRIYK